MSSFFKILGRPRFEGSDGGRIGLWTLPGSFGFRTPWPSPGDFASVPGDLESENRVVLALGAMALLPDRLYF